MLRLPLALLFAVTLAGTSAQTFTYTFEAEYAAGVDGTIQVSYDDPTSSKATITADLDFSRVSMDALKAADGNCTEPVSEFQWHIHVNWNSSQYSNEFAQCGKAFTGNHYDPLHACGPNSEFAGTPECLAKVASYNCTPENYAANPLVCEKGDLAGKFGNFKWDQGCYYQAKGSWVDEHYPMVAENTPQWNIILHAVCGKATPRIACALGQRSDYDWHWKSATPAPTTYANPTPATTSSYSKPTPAPTYMRRAM